MHWFLFAEFAGAFQMTWNSWNKSSYLQSLDINLEKDSLALMGRIDLRKAHASGHSMVAWHGARSAKMVEALNYMNK
ncbi:hypothetical protein MKW92_017135, partial [Papaver armeniacum]